MSNKVIKLKTKKNHTKWIIIIILLAILGIIYFSLSFNKIAKVEIVGKSKYSKEEICSMVGINEGDSFLKSFIAKRKGFNMLPFIEEAKVKFSTMNKVEVLVKDKEITSLIPFQDDYVVLDKNGYVLGYEDEAIESVPISLGINLDEAIVGKIVPIDERVLNSVLLIYFSAKKNFVNVNEIVFLGGSPDKIHLYIGSIDIFLGDASNIEEKMKTAKAVLDKLPKNAKGVLDLSNNKKAYVFKNDFELKYYVIDDRGFCAVDKNGIIKKISHSKFSDSITVANLSSFEGNVGEEAVIKEEEKKLLNSIIGEAKKINFKFKGIDFKFEEKKELAILTDRVIFNFKNADEIVKKLKVSKKYYDSLDEKKEASKEEKVLPVVHIEKIINKYRDLD